MNYVVSFYLDSYQDDNNNRDNYKYISWSPYDRMMIREVNSFRELCVSDFDFEKSSDNSGWIGVEQKMHLISDDPCENKITINEGLKNGCIISVDGREYDFYCYVTLNYSAEINNIIRTNAEAGKKVKNEIKQKVIDLIVNDQHDYKMFRSIGSENIVLLLLSNTMSDIITTVNKILSIQYFFKSAKPEEATDVFSDVCVFTGLNRVNLIEGEKSNDVDVIIKLILKNQNPDPTIKWIVKKLGVDEKSIKVTRVLSKKSTIVIRFPKGTLKYDAFGDKGVFNENNSEYSKYIVKSRTFFVDENKNLTPTILDMSQFALTQLKKTENSDENSIKSSNTVTRFLLREYKRMLQMPRYGLWHRILENQEKSISKFMDYYDQHDKIAGSYMLNDIQRALSHINQACSPISEVPYHNYLYSGSFNDLLMTYYGIINQIFQIAYKLPHVEDTKQHSIKFAICMNSSTKIESTMFTMRGTTDRFVIFYFPYDSLWNYAQNIRLLIHEVFHYVAPYDRKTRAEYLLNLIFKIVLNGIFRVVIENYCKKEEIENSISEKIISYWLSFVMNEYDKETNRKMLSQSVASAKEEFFVDSIPEWFTSCIDNKGIDAVLIKSYEFASKIMLENHEEFIKKIKLENDFRSTEIETVCRLFPSEVLENLLYAEAIKGEKELIWAYTIRSVKLAVLAAKEAFCDIWAIDILKISLADYIHYILSTLIDTKDYATVWSYFNKSDRTITPDSAVLRLNILFDFMLSEGETSDSKIIPKLNEAINELKIKSPEQAEIYDMIQDGYDEFLYNKSYWRSDLNGMAFYAQQKMFAAIEHEEGVSRLRTIYSHDLSTSIFAEDLDCFLDYEMYTNTSQIECGLFGNGEEKDGRNIVFPSTPTHGKYLQTFYARSVGGYITNVNRILNEQDQPMWFRGVCNHNFNLLPSLFRKCDEKLSLYVNQSNVMKFAFLLTKSMTDVWNLPIEQQMACLQHYGAATNLLDFSLDMLVALHFAINPDVPEDRVMIDKGVYQPVVYIFDPIKYCNAIRILKDESILSSIRYDILPYEFDFNLNKEAMSKYFVNDSSFDYLIEHNEKHNKIYTPGNRCDEFPIPIIIRQSNPRIVAQDGTFVAYSLDARPTSMNKGHQYSYLDLLIIRKRYVDFCALHNCPKCFDFIHTIYIEKASVTRMRKELEMLNIGKHRVYPELKNLISESMRRFEGQNKSTI